MPRKPIQQPPPSPDLIEAADVAALFAPFAALMGRGVVLAVSGGSDSIGLMQLFSRWLDQGRASGSTRPPVHVATIDHGLRAGSSGDAAFVVAAAGALGFPVSCHRWEGIKPVSGLAEAAREARYGLLAEVMHDVGAHVLMTAHTADDQAETLLMRLARGSGIEGLAGMAPVRPLSAVSEAWLVRPLLGLEKRRIASDLAARGVAWRLDPTNADTDFERPRLRAAEAALRALGLTPANLGLSARRLRRASDALDAMSQAVLRSGGVRVHPLGLVEIDLALLAGQPDEIALRVLRRAIEVSGGAAAPISLAALEAVLAEVRGDGAIAWTLAKAALQVKAGVLRLEREPGRSPLPRAALAEGARIIWDGRFEIEIRRGAPGLEVGALGAAGLSVLDALRVPRPKVPARTLRAIPAIWRDDTLIAAPLLGFASASAMQLDLQIELRGFPPGPAGAVAPGQAEAPS